MVEILTVRPLFIEMGSRALTDAGGLARLAWRTQRALAHFMHLSPQELGRIYGGACLHWYYPQVETVATVEMALGVPRCQQVAAWNLVCSNRWRRATQIILLGHEVARPFGFVRSDPYCHWQEWGYWKGRRVAMIPHPCGGSRWWKNLDQRTQVINFVRSAAGMARLPVQQNLL